MDRPGHDAPLALDGHQNRLWDEAHKVPTIVGIQRSQGQPGGPRINAFLGNPFIFAIRNVRQDWTYSDEDGEPDPPEMSHCEHALRWRREVWLDRGGRLPTTQRDEGAEGGSRVLHAATNLAEGNQSRTVQGGFRAEVDMLAQLCQLREHADPARRPSKGISIRAELNGL